MFPATFAISSTHLILIVQCISLAENTFSTYFTASISVNNKLTNVNYVTFAVEHDVAIVPVLDLKQEADNAVGCHANDEVVPRLYLKKIKLHVKNMKNRQKEIILSTWLVFKLHMKVLAAVSNCCYGPSISSVCSISFC